VAAGHSLGLGASLALEKTGQDPLMPRVTIHVGGPGPLRTAGIHRQPMATDSARLAVLVQLSTDAFTASRRNADRERRSVPAAIVSP
jgi:hypothetical protein